MARSVFKGWIVLVTVFSYPALGLAEDRSPQTAEIARSLLHTKTSKSYSEWKDGTDHPSRVFERARAKKSAGHWLAVCSALAQLKTEDLAYFHDEIGDLRNSGLSSCRPALQRKLSEYWKKSQELLDQYVSRPGFLPDEAATLPSVEKPIDPSTGPQFFRGDLKDGEIALTFDDGPNPEDTPKILAALADAGIRANFFEVGQNAHDHPELSKSVADAGHIVGSHTWSHQQLSKLSLDHAETEIDSGRDAVTAAAGIFNPFFRFPYGERKTVLPLVDYVKNEKMAMFYWNMDSLDWKIPDTVALYKNILAELDREKGGIILFHDVHPQTTIVLPQFLRELGNRKFTTIVFVPH